MKIDNQSGSSCWINLWSVILDNNLQEISNMNHVLKIANSRKCMLADKTTLYSVVDICLYKKIMLKTKKGDIKYNRPITLFCSIYSLLLNFCWKILEGKEAKTLPHQSWGCLPVYSVHAILQSFLHKSNVSLVVFKSKVNKRAAPEQYPTHGQTWSYGYAETVKCNC